MRPQTRYARSGDLRIAYQVVGGGQLDLVLVHGWVSHIDLQWEEPRLAADRGEVLVSATVRDLVAGSGITFQDRGDHALKGLPERLRLFAVVSV